MPLLLPLGAGGTAGPVYIRRGGAYVRYDGKMAIDKKLCDCSCDECSCASLPDTLYARLTKYQWQAGDGVIAIESATWDITLSKGCPEEPEITCGGPCNPGSTWHGSFQERSTPDCSGVPYGKYMMDNILTVECTSGSGLLTLTACNAWNKLETCPDGYVWRYPTATPTVQLTVESCAAGEVYATYENLSCVNVECIRSLIVSTSPIA